MAVSSTDNPDHPRHQFTEEDLLDLEEDRSRLCSACGRGKVVCDEDELLQLFRWCTRCDYIADV